MPGKIRKGTVRAGWNVDPDVAERVRAGAAARGIAANDFVERSVRLVAQLQEAALEEAANGDLLEHERWATNMLEAVGLSPVTV